MKGFTWCLVCFFCAVYFEVKAQEADTTFSPCVSDIFVPNSFHAHGDCINDLLIPRLAGKPVSYELKIFNRWGELIFKTEKSDEGWDGKHNKATVEMGTFYWVITIKCDQSDKTYSKQGTVSVIR